MFNPKGYNKLDDPREGSEMATFPPPAAYHHSSGNPYGNVQSGDDQYRFDSFEDRRGNVPAHFVLNPNHPKPAAYMNNSGPTEAEAHNFYRGTQAYRDGIRNRTNPTMEAAHDFYRQAPSYTMSGAQPRDPFRDPVELSSDPRSPPPPPPPLKDGKSPMVNVSNVRNKDEEALPQELIGRRSDISLPWWKRWLRSKWGRRFTSTFVCWTLSLVQIIVFFAELGHYGSLTGKPIETEPFNWMIGPSVYSLINYGARYQPCMRAIPNVQNSTELISWPCPNSTTTGFDCALTTLCGNVGSNVPTPQPGLGTYDQPAPNQWLRLIIPIFLHVGLIHIAFNLLIQLTVGRAMEIALGHGPFIIIYLLCGIFGFLLGANFAGTNQASMGASGAIFGMLAINILVCLYARPIKWKDLGWLLVDVLVSLCLGLIPGVDNFSHIGGILMGFCSGIILLRTPWFCSTSKREDLQHMNYSSKKKTAIPPPAAGFREMVSGMRTWREKDAKWWVWVGVRVLAFVLALLSFILLLKNFYVWHGTCSWCRHLSCLPWGDYCDRGDLSFITHTTTTTTPNPGGEMNQRRAIENIARGIIMSFTR